MQDKKIIAISLVLMGLLAGAYFYFVKNGFVNVSASQMEAIKIKAENFINENLVAPGTNAKIESITEEGGVYKIDVDVNGQTITSYITQDGKNFFPQAYDMNGQESAEPSQEESSQNTAQTISQSAVPEVKLFVMSYCPYGLQMEKGILPALNLLGSKIDFQLEFVDYIMHEQKEIDENLSQYCVQERKPEKFYDYLACFANEGDSEVCLGRVGLTLSDLTKCLFQSDSRFQINAKAADKNQWRNSLYPPFDVNYDDNVKYGVRGSPTLVINGTVAETNRDSQSLLNIICSAFIDRPGECGRELSGVIPSPGFGGGAGPVTSAQCEN